jgi:hypothetical protein
MSERRFHSTHSGETFELGRLDGESFSGVYLSPAYMDRLREVFYAASLRLDLRGEAALPDAVKNILGIVGLLTKVHGAQLKVEGYPWTDADRAAISAAEKQIEAALDALRRFRGDDDPTDGEDPE